MLKFDYEKIHGKNITEVHGENVRVMNDGSFECDRIVIDVATAALELSVNIDTDELIIELHEPYENTPGTLSNINDYLNFVGRKLGWVWTAKNYRGYDDAFMLALGEAVPDALDPAYAFVGAGSSICVYSVTPLKLPETNRLRP
ncbi:MAG: hypothetical protein GXP06_00855 [Alphaproteobacteria bacterium]|nr:hypothetical protein [Alphaproteobacteria bacterium]